MMKRNFLLVVVGILSIVHTLDATTAKCISHNTVLYRPFLSYEFIDKADLNFDVLYQRAQNHTIYQPS